VMGNLKSRLKFAHHWFRSPSNSVALCGGNCCNLIRFAAMYTSAWPTNQPTISPMSFVAMLRVFRDIGPKMLTRLPIFTCRTLVWHGTKFAVFFLCSAVADVSATVAPIGVKFCIMVHIGLGQVFSLLGAVPPGDPKCDILGLNFGHLNTNISKTVSRCVTCQLELNVSWSTRAF